MINSLIGLGFEPLKDFVAQDDGQGVYIKEWLSSKPQPTNKELKQGLKLFQEQQVRENKSKENETKIIQTLGADNKIDAIVKQLNLINEAIATGDNTQVKKIDTIVKQILNS